MYDSSYPVSRDFVLSARIRPPVCEFSISERIYCNRIVHHVLYGGLCYFDGKLYAWTSI